MKGLLRRLLPHQHHWTAWSPCLIEDDEGGRYGLIEIHDVLWRMCMRCGRQEERDLSCVSS